MATAPANSANGQLPTPASAPVGPEVELFRRAQGGDRGAFGQLAIRTQGRLYNAILRIIGDRDEARELTQETFVKALTAIDTFRGQSQPYTWLFRIGVNLAISQIRRDSRRRTFSLDVPRPGRAGSDQERGLADRMSREQPLPSAELERKETQQRVLTALGSLEPEVRALLVMRDIDGLDYEQMAEALEVPLGTLKSRIFRARLALREALEEAEANANHEKGRRA